MSAEFIGTATMASDGTVILALRAEQNGDVGHGCVEYAPDDEHYDEVLEHIGGLEPGETKSVRPWPDD